MDQLLDLIKDLAVVHGKVTLSSGKEADYYIDLRRVSLHRTAGPLIGTALRDLTADWDYDAVGGLTLGADPVACAVMHASGGAVDAFLVRKAQKAHGMQQQIEGPSIEGRRVLISRLFVQAKQLRDPIESPGGFAGRRVGDFSTIPTVARQFAHHPQPLGGVWYRPCFFQR